MMQCRAQAALEYIFLIGIVAAALIVILAYVSRGFQGRLRSQADEMGEQYSPGGMDINTVQKSIVTLNSTAVGKISTSKSSTSMATTGHENVVTNLDQDTWYKNY